MADATLPLPADRADPQAQALLELSRAIGEGRTDLGQALSRITETAAGILAVDRVSIWLYEDQRTEIRCVDLYQRQAGTHEQGMVLARADHPRYFEALAGERTVAAADAERDPRTSEFTRSYLRPLGIGAMLDTPIRRGGEVVGVVCHEHVGSARTWSLAEQWFAASIGDLAGLALSEAQRREAEASLRRSEERFRLLTENMSDLVTGVDPRGVITYASPNHEERVGLPPETLVGSSVFDHVHPDDAPVVSDAIRNALARMSPVTVSFRARLGDGSHAWYEGTGRAYRTPDGRVEGVVTSRNVSERMKAERTARELQAQLSQAQRLEALGRLAGGIAHDFNNLLTAILGHLEVALAQESADASLRSELSAASDVVLRAADLTQQLLALGRNQAIDPQILDVNAAIEDLGRMIRRVIGEDIQLEIDLDPALPSVWIGKAQLDQVLMNLAINCRDAMPRGGRLQFRTQRVEVDAAFAYEHVGLRRGLHASIEVCDEGAGMDDQTRSRVFDPFFTTKEPGKGVGLGLSTAYQIVRDAGGVIELESELRRGTRVRLWLPAAEKRPAANAAPGGKDADSLAGHERILVVEDEGAVRRLLERALRSQGYEVHSASDGVQALERLEALGGRVDLVLSDVVMPVMGGVELARRLRAAYPEIELLMLSGYAPPTADDADADVLRSDRVLQKPFTTRRLLERVRTILGPSTVVVGAG